jgi:hypothetical protein
MTGAGSNDAIRAYDEARLSYRLLESIEVTQLLPPDVSVAELRVVLTLVESPTRADRLELQFHGVRGLTLEQSELSVTTLSLRIESIRNRQWEGLNYSVVDDDAALSLLCRTIKTSRVKGRAAHRTESQ